MKPKIPHPLRDPACSLCDIIKYGYFHQLRLLINTGIDPERRDSNKRTPIMLCAFMEPESWGIGIARILIEDNARVDKRDKYGRNVLHYACIYERQGLIQVLLKAMDFDLNQEDKLGNTALHYAALSGNLVVTQIIARVFKRYKVCHEKTNKRGFTAAEEALRTGNSKCGHVIEQEMAERRPGSAMKDVRFADEVVIEQNMLKGQGSSSNIASLNHIKRSYARPWSNPALARRDSSLSSISMEERGSSNSFRSRSNLSNVGSYSARKPYIPLVAMGIRHENDIVHCAEADDFRNKPEFVFKLVHLHYDANDWHPTAMGHGLTNRGTAWTDACSTNQSHAVISSSGWRQDLKSLFKVYESQCSASWRAVQRAKSLAAEEQERLATEMTEEDEKGKKPRRFSNHKTGLANKEQAPELKRRLSTTRMRRRSSIHGLLGKMTAGPTSSRDGSLNTSTESVNSVASPSKRRGSDRELAPPSSRSENTSIRSGVKQQPATDRAYSPSPTLIPAITVPTSFSSTKTSADAVAAAAAAAALLTSSTASANINRAEMKNPSKTPHQSSREETSKSRARKVSSINRSQSSADHKDDDDKKNIINGAGASQEKRQVVSQADCSATGSFAKRMPVPQVRESLVEDRKISADVLAKPDTSRLWVQNPYVDDEDDDYDDYSDDGVSGEESGTDA